jgi:hypothetical protein
LLGHILIAPITIATSKTWSILEHKNETELIKHSTNSTDVDKMSTSIITLIPYIRMNVFSKQAK